MKINLQDEIFDVVKKSAEKLNSEVYVVGGYVRDLLLNKENKDIDFVTVGNGINLAKKVTEILGNEATLTVYKNFGTALVQYKTYKLEFVGARKESYKRNSRKPIVENGTLQDDQLRRDFTINALAISLNNYNYGELIDPFNGINDLKKKIIRTPTNPEITFSDDPLRMLRAIRFATVLNFIIEEHCFEAINKNRDRIKIVSAERITDELNKIMMSNKPSKGFILLDKTGLLEIILPWIHNLKGVAIIDNKAHKDNFLHSLKVLDNISNKSDNLWLRWTALLHDVGKPIVKKFDPEHGWTFHGHEIVGSKLIPEIFRTLKLPMGQQMKYIQKLIELHLRPMALVENEVTDSAVRRLIFDAGEDLEDLMLLCEADVTSKNDEKVKRYLNNFKLVRKKFIEIEEKDKIRNFKPPIDGNTIMEVFGIPPCKEIGIIKNTIKNAILDGIIKNDYDEAYKLMLEKGKELGLKPVKELKP